MPKEAEKIWTDVDRYFVETLHLSDPILDSTMKANAAAELPAIDVAPNQGKLLHLLAKLVSAKRILEIGTLGGYSTIWLARALPPNGRLISLEFSAKHAEVAKSNVQRADLSERVEIRVGAALDSLPSIEKEGIAPFDFIFIDADHRYPSVKADWENYSPMIAPGGIFAFHDTQHIGDDSYGVEQLWNEITSEGDVRWMHSVMTNHCGIGLLWL